MTTKIDPLLTLNEVAELERVSVWRVRQMCSGGILPCIKHGKTARTWRVVPRDLEEYRRRKNTGFKFAK